MSEPNPVSPFLPTLSIGGKLVANVKNVNLTLDSKVNQKYVDSTRYKPPLGIEIVASKYVPETATFPTGMIMCCDGQRLPRKGFEWHQDRFTTFEESDLTWLLGLKIVKEEVEERPVFFVFQKSFKKLEDDFLRGTMATVAAVPVCGSDEARRNYDGIKWQDECNKFKLPRSFWPLSRELV